MEVTGNMLERYVYKVYGEHKVLNPDFTVKCDPLTSTDARSCVSTSPFLWGDSLYDEETDLYWMRNRYYNKEMKRFINQDPIGIWGDASNLGNGFAYAAGMVVNAVDPSGLAGESDKKIEYEKKTKIDVDEPIVITATPPEEEKKEDDDDDNGSDFSWDEFKTGYKIYTTIFQGEYNIVGLAKKKFKGWSVRQALSTNGLGVKSGIKYLSNTMKYGMPALQILEIVNSGSIDNFVFTVFPIVCPIGYVPYVAGVWAYYYNNHVKDVPSEAMVEMAKTEPFSFRSVKGGVNGNRARMKQVGGDPDYPLKKNFAHRGVAFFDAHYNGKFVRFWGRFRNGQLTGRFFDGNKIQTNIIMNSNGEYDGYYWSDVEGGRVQTDGYRPNYYPSDPGGADPIQSYLAKKLINDIFKRNIKDEDSPGQWIAVDNGEWTPSFKVYVKNPYYINKDPILSIIGKKSPNSGSITIVRNPFVPSGGYTPWSSTAEELANSPYNPGNIDPYLE